jgi:transcriptional regulator with PAS, ATPase and Fis domain
MNKSKVIAVTFNGFQGAAATAVLLEKHPEADLWISSARKIAETLSAIPPRKTSQVYLVGVGARDCSNEDLLAALRPLLEGKVSVTWFYPWEDLAWLKSEMAPFPHFALVQGSGEPLPVLVAAALGCGSGRTKELIRSAQDAEEGKMRSFHQNLVDAATVSYLKFQDAAAFPNAIRKLADPSLITEADREAVRRFQRYGDRVLLGKSAPMKRLRDLIRKAGSDHAGRVLILGETGTGKELVARDIHNISPRKDKPFIPVSCANIGEHLLESDLFGHEKGAFTGAVRQKSGQFELADGGTLFLDEVGELDPSLQARLLRVLQDGTFYRVGGTAEIRVDVRVIAATNRDLRKAVREGMFREDLYYRLNEVVIKTPPLREHPEDVPLIAKDILHRMAAERGAETPRLTPRQIQTLQGYHWPGNVRQLESILRRAAILKDWDLQKHLADEEGFPAHQDAALEILPLEEQTNRYVLNVFHAMKRNITQTAKALRVSPNTLKARLRKLTSKT